MIKTLIAASILSLAAVSGAQAKEKPVSFSHNGVNYTYTVKQISDTRRVIEGYATPGSAFRLVVANGLVVGKSNGSPVSFRVADTVAIADDATKIASR